MNLSKKEKELLKIITEIKNEEGVEVILNSIGFNSPTHWESEYDTEFTLENLVVFCFEELWYEYKEII